MTDGSTVQPIELSDVELDGFMNQGSGVTAEIRGVLGLDDDARPMTANVVEGLIAKGWRVRVTQMGDHARSARITASAHLPLMREWGKRLDLDLSAELGFFRSDPNGARGRELAVMVRDHEDGGVDAVVECVHEFCGLFGFTPVEDAELLATIVGL